MCRLLKVLVVAPPEQHAALRRTLASLEYEIVATLPPIDATGVTAEVALVAAPDPDTVRALKSEGKRVVTLGPSDGADLVLDETDAASFKTRVWELFRAR